MSPLVEPACVCKEPGCGIQYAYVPGLTESRSCCYFCSQRKRRARQAADEHVGADHPSARGADGSGLLVACALGAVLSGMLWVLIVLAVLWVLELPPPILVRLAAVVLLFAGTGLVFAAMAHMEITVRPSPDRTRGRRPERDVVPLDDARASTTSTAPPQAGGRALREVR